MLFGTFAGLNTLRLALPGALRLRALQSVTRTVTTSQFSIDPVKPVIWLDLQCAMCLSLSQV